MTQTELVKETTANLNKKYEAESKKTLPVSTVTDVTNTFIDTIKTKVAAGEKVTIGGFGSFEAVDRAAREGRNPATGETIKIAASKAPKFKAAKAFKEVLN